MSKLTKKLKSLTTLPMHMPGHKRNIKKFPDQAQLFDIDITEIDGFDNLHNPQGILKESMEKAARLYHSENSIYLVNGSTCGILAGICAVLKDGDTIITDRNSHKSVYNAIELCGAKPVYIKPGTHTEYGISTGVTPDSVENALKNNPDARLVMITSPTYEGAVCDVSGICEVAHRYSVPVMVDSAHGAHLGFYKFPKNPVACGADIVVESLHKTLPSLTQTAILHVTDRYRRQVADRLTVFETSSPSYLLLASIDSCMDIIEDEKIFSEWYDNASEFKEASKSLKNLRILEPDSEFFDYDISKIVILTGDSALLSKRLRDNGIEPEMTAPGYVLCMTGAGDTRESLDRLRNVLFEIDSEFSPFEKNAIPLHIPESAMNIKTAKGLPCGYIAGDASVGKISAEYIWAYPPGVPLIAPGELIDTEISEIFQAYTAKKIELFGSSLHIDGKILVINT